LRRPNSVGKVGNPSLHYPLKLDRKGVVVRKKSAQAVKRRCGKKNRQSTKVNLGNLSPEARPKEYKIPRVCPTANPLGLVYRLPRRAPVGLHTPGRGGAKKTKRPPKANFLVIRGLGKKGWKKKEVGKRPLLGQRRGDRQP